MLLQSGDGTSAMEIGHGKSAEAFKLCRPEPVEVPLTVDKRSPPAGGAFHGKADGSVFEIFGGDERGEFPAVVEPAGALDNFDFRMLFRTLVYDFGQSQQQFPAVAEGGFRSKLVSEMERQKKFRRL